MCAARAAEAPEPGRMDLGLVAELGRVDRGAPALTADPGRDDGGASPNAALAAEPGRVDGLFARARPMCCVRAVASPGGERVLLQLAPQWCQSWGC